MDKITVRKYGARLVGDDAAIVQSLRVQNRLWNALVEIEHANRDEYRKIILESDAELSELAATADSLDERLEQVRTKRNRERATARSKKIEGAAGYASQIKALSTQLKEIRAKMREARVRAKAAAKPRLTELETQRRQQVKQAAAAAGLWWAHLELVLNKFDVARQRSFATKSTLRFHPFDGNGIIGIRSQAGILLSRPPNTDLLKLREATPEELGHLRAEGARKRIVAIDFRIGKPDESGAIPKATFLVTIHKGMPLPLDIPLKIVTVKREARPQPDFVKWYTNSAPSFVKWYMNFTFVESDAELVSKPLERKAVGIDFGWRSVRDREWGDKTGLRVAVLVDSDGRKEHITLPPKFIARFKHADLLRSQLDTLTNEFWTEINPKFTKTILDQMSEDEWLRLLIERARRARNLHPARLCTIAKAHNENPVLGKDVNKAMQHFAETARKLLIRQFNVRNRTIEYRKHLYRNTAARLATSYGMIAVKNTDFRSIAQLVDSDGNETELGKQARTNRFIVSPSELRNAIRNAAKREQCELVDVPPARTTTTCSSCGHVHQGPIEDLTFVCQGCGKVHDQDENSAALCLKIALESPS